MLVPPFSGSNERDQVMRKWLCKCASIHLQRSKHIRGHVVLEAFSSHILQDCADQAIAVVRIEFDIAWSVDARGQDLLHEQPHGRLLTISKTIANEAVVQTRSVLKQLPEGNWLLEGRGYLEGFEVAIHIAIEVDSSLLAEAHDCDRSERL